jgi:hypothetical protein
MYNSNYFNLKKISFVLIAGVCLLSFLLNFAVCNTKNSNTVYVWEKLEIKLTAVQSYDNPYTDVTIWIDLEGPEFEERCYGFWNGGNEFVVRVLANKAGDWSWRSDSNVEDAGLSGRRGGFKAVDWTEKELDENPNRKGMVKASKNGHTFEYSDGTPYFLLGDTWWPTATFRYPWYEGDKDRPIGPQAGFKDYVKYRKKQGYNCIAMIAALPNWANDDKPDYIETANGTELRQAWHQIGTNSAKDMYDEDGNRAFLFPGKVPGYEHYFPDINRINPDYFKNLDKKIDYLNAHGFVPFIEVARRDIGPAWYKYYKWPESYARYIQYVWTRYQANICFFSPIHFDNDGSLPAEHWNQAANSVIKEYGPPPFGTMVSCNPTGSSLENFGHVDQAKWIDFHQIGNFHEEMGHGHKSYPLLTDIFNAQPPLPGINGEPYYDGQHETEPGSEEAALYSRSAMYGSVLSGGLGGHIYGAGKEGETGGAMWGGNVEEAARFKVWDGIQWTSGDQLRHLKTFIMSEGDRYKDLNPKVDLLSPNKTMNDNDWIGWAFCSATADKEWFLLYFEKDCEQAWLSGLLPEKSYTAKWFDPRNGGWLEGKSAQLKSDASGKVKLPLFPGNALRSETDWALRLMISGNPENVK